MPYTVLYSICAGFMCIAFSSVSIELPFPRDFVVRPCRYMFLISGLVFLMSGAVGYLATLTFNWYIYSAVKID